MAKYYLVCDVPSVDSITFYSNSLRLPECENGTIHAVPYEPGFSNMTADEMIQFESFVLTIAMLAVLGGASVHFLISAVARVTGKSE